MTKIQSKRSRKPRPIVRIGFMKIHEVRKYYAFKIDDTLIERAREWFANEHPIETESDLLQLDETILLEFLTECADTIDPANVDFVEEELLPPSASGPGSLWFAKWDADGRRTVIDFPENS